MSAIAEWLRELWAERLRVGMVALGVLWGTLSLTVLLGFGTEFVGQMHGMARSNGVGLLRFWSGATTMPFDGLPAGRRIPVTVDDAKAIRAGVPGVRAVSEEFSSGSGNPVRFGDTVFNVSLSGVRPEFGELRNQPPEPGGRFLNALDLEQHRRVAFLGDRTKRRLFGDADATGQRIEIHGVPFTVVGSLRGRATLSNYNGQDRDKVMIPATTFRDLLGWLHPTYLVVGLEDPAQETSVVAACYEMLASRHRFDPRDRESLTLHSHIEITNMVDTMVWSSQILNGIVGLFGLLVAIVGVANVMSVLVEERRQQIGVWMALGATPRVIAARHVGEALLIAFVGGASGLALGGAMLWAVGFVPMGEDARAYLGWPHVSFAVGSTVVGILAVAAMLAGWFPARRAARLDPVTALREE